MKRSFKQSTRFLFFFCCLSQASSLVTVNVGGKRNSKRTTSLASAKTSKYNYFAYGSNMALATMTDLRNLNPISSTAAILPGHELIFNVRGIPLIEPSFASVEPISSQESCVHGILYELTQQDFIRVCQTEGVPLTYRLHRCEPIPYEGNGIDAGINALENFQKQKGLEKLQNSVSITKNKGSIKENAIQSYPAFTLRAMPLLSAEILPNIPPSQAYTNVLIRGATEFQLDADYVQYLKEINVAVPIPLFGNGQAENWLKNAERRKRFKS